MKLLLGVCVLCCMIPSTALAGTWSASQQEIFKASEVHAEYRSGTTRVVVDQIRDHGQRIVTYINGDKYRTGYVFWRKGIDGMPGAVYASWSQLHKFQSCFQLSTFGNVWDFRSAPYTLFTTANEQLTQQPPAIKQISTRHRGTRTYVTLKRRLGSARVRASVILHRSSSRPLVSRVRSESRGATRRSVTRFSYNVRGAINAPQNKC